MNMINKDGVRQTNEAPEKIYISTTSQDGTYYISNQYKRLIEYSRTDALIEKVESFLNKHDDRDSYTIGYIKKHFKEIIKEVGL